MVQFCNIPQFFNIDLKLFIFSALIPSKKWYQIISQKNWFFIATVRKLGELCLLPIHLDENKWKILYDKTSFKWLLGEFVIGKIANIVSSEKLIAGRQTFLF